MRTTFIVGHPGETDAAFDKLCDFVARREFDRVGVFTYSNEDGTHAAKLADELGAVPAKEMERRRRELMRIQRSISRKKMKAMVGRELAVLVEGPSEESEYLFDGRHEGQAPEIDGSVFLALADGQKSAAAGRRRARARHRLRRLRSRRRPSKGTIAPTRMKRAPKRLPVLTRALSALHQQRLRSPADQRDHDGDNRQHQQTWMKPPSV